MNLPLHSQPRPLTMSVLWLACLAAFTLSWVLARHVVTDAPPIWSGAGRLLASCCALLLVLAADPSARISMADLQPRVRQVILLSILGFAGYFTLTFLALRLMPPTDLVMLLALTPGVTYLLGLALFGEPSNRLRGFGVALATVCVMLFQGQGTLTFGPDRITGMILALVAVTGYALYGLVYGRTMRGLPVVGLLAVMTGTATVLVTPLAWSLEGPPPLLPNSTLLAIGGIGALLSAPIYIMVNRLVLSGGAFLATLIGLVAPFTVLLLEAGLGLRQISAPDLLLMAVTAAALVLVLRAGNPHNDTGTRPAPPLQERMP